MYGDREVAFHEGGAHDQSIATSVVTRTLYCRLVLLRPLGSLARWILSLKNLAWLLTTRNLDYANHTGNTSRRYNAHQHRTSICLYVMPKRKHYHETSAKLVLLNEPT